MMARGEAMTRLLEKVIEEVQRLPEREQEAFARLWLEELEDERRWERSFAASQDVLEKMAAEALREFETGQTEELDPDKL